MHSEEITHSKSTDKKLPDTTTGPPRAVNTFQVLSLRGFTRFAQFFKKEVDKKGSRSLGYKNELAAQLATCQVTQNLGLLDTVQGFSASTSTPS